MPSVGRGGRWRKRQVTTRFRPKTGGGGDKPDGAQTGEQETSMIKKIRRAIFPRRQKGKPRKLRSEKLLVPGS